MEKAELPEISVVLFIIKCGLSVHRIDFLADLLEGLRARRRLWTRAGFMLLVCLK